MDGAAPALHSQAMNARRMPRLALMSGTSCAAVNTFQSPAYPRAVLAGRSCAACESETVSNCQRSRNSALATIT